MKGYKELGNRYLKHRKKRSMLVMTSMVLATMFIYIMSNALVNYWKFGLEAAKECYHYHVEIPNVTKEQMEKIENYATVKNVDFAYSTYDVFFDDDYYGYGASLQMIYLEDSEQSTFNFDLVEGRMPENSSEILVNEDDLHLFKNNVNVGDEISVCTIVDEENVNIDTFTISGVYTREYSDEYLTCAFSIAPEGMSLSAYVRFGVWDDWNAYSESLLADIGIDAEQKGAYNINGELAYCYGKGDLNIFYVVALMVIVLVIYTCMVMVRGLFSSNLMDKLQDFNILKAMGATNKKIKRIFKREVYIEAGISFVIGVVLSHLCMFILENVAMLYNFNFDFSIVATVFALFFMYITVSLAVIEPFGLLKKVSIVEGIKANYAIKTKKEKKRSGKLLRIFGIEGQYAYKNIRRNSRSFWNAIASFSVSMLLATVLITSIVNINEMLNWESMGTSEKEPYDIYTVIFADDITSEKLKENKEKIKSKGYIIDVDENYEFLFKTFNDEYIFEVTSQFKRAMPNFTEFTQPTTVKVDLYSKDQLEALNAYMLNGVDATSIIEDGGVIVVNKYNIYNYETEKMEAVDIYNINIGDEINIVNPKFAMDELKEGTFYQNLSEKIQDESFYEKMEIKGTCSRALHKEGIVQIIMSYDYVAENYGDENISALCYGFYIDVNESKFDRADFEEMLYKETNMAEWDYTSELKWVNESFKTVKIVVGFIVAFIMIMGIVSVLHNMINEQQLRKKEVSILRAIGMSKKKLNRMLILEKLIIGFMSWIIGTGLGLLFTKIVLISILYFFEASMVVPWLAYLITGVVLMGIMLLLSMIMVLSMGKMKITESIRNND